VYDEMKRRVDSQGKPAIEQIHFLPVREDFHPKRNQTRQKLATLPESRYHDLASDVFFEICRRYPSQKAIVFTKPKGGKTAKANGAKPALANLPSPPPAVSQKAGTPTSPMAAAGTPTSPSPAQVALANALRQAPEKPLGAGTAAVKASPVGEALSIPQTRPQTYSNI